MEQTVMHMKDSSYTLFENKSVVGRKEGRAELLKCQELAVIAEQLQGVLSDAPGHTSGVQHQIKIPLRVVVQQQLYGVPVASHATIEEEIHRILVTSITEPSDSLSSRPIIIMPKLGVLCEQQNLNLMKKGHPDDSHLKLKLKHPNAKIPPDHRTTLAIKWAIKKLRYYLTGLLFPGVE
ncbi:hypothetical protein SRHO_G00260830 [Serrasalmus rhombeus]